MKKILVVGNSQDPHVNAVTKGLEARGIATSVLDGTLSRDSDETVVSSVSIHLSESTLAASQVRVDGVPLDSFTSIWLRRPITPPWSALTDAKPSIEFQERHWQLMGLLSEISRSHSLVANPFDASLVAETKLGGLKAATAASFKIPETLFSSNQPQILSFFDQHAGRIVYKPHRQHRISARHFVGTTQPTRDQLAERRQAQGWPGIYQRRVDIDFELRVLVLGKTCITAKIKNHSEHIDVRIGLGKSNSVENYALSTALARQCCLLARKAGLTTASIDLAVDVHGDVFFLDLNPFGQFLWVEQFCPEIVALDAFVDFLASGDKDFDYQRKDRSRQLRLADFSGATTDQFFP